MKLVSALVLGLSLAACQGAQVKPDKPVTTTKADDSCAMKSDAKADATTPTSFDHKPKVGEKARCPVSGDTFVVDADTVSTEYQGKWYAFCCGDCPSDFQKDPGKYAK